MINSRGLRVAFFMNQDKKQKMESGEMKRTLGVASVFAICTGAAFSSGFFLLPGYAANETGPSMPLVFLLAGIMMLPAVFSISELSSAMPRSGGPYFFITRSFGPLFGIIGAIGKYFQLLFKGGFAFVGVGYYLSLLIEVPIIPLAVGLIISFTLLNLTGAKQSAKTEIYLVIALIIILSLFVIAGILEITPRSASALERFQPLLPFGIKGFVAGLALIFISFGGMGQVASVSGEIKDPSRNLPKGMLLSLAVVTFFYLAGTSIIIALIDQEALSDHSTPVAAAAEEFTRFSIPVSVIVIAALAAFASTGNAVILSAARYPLALSRDRLLWNKFSHVNKKGIPLVSVVATGIILIGLVVAFDVEEIAKLASAFLLFIFAGLCSSIVVFRESKTDNYNPDYKSPLYPWTQIAGIIVYILLIVAIGWEAMLFVAGVVILGLIWYFWGISETSSFSAAIYPLFARIAKSGMQGTADEETDLSAVAGHAIFITLEQESSLDEALEKASHAIKERLGGEREEIEGELNTEVRHWMHQVKFNISVAPVLLEGIGPPEMIIMKGSIRVNDKTTNGLIIILDDKNSSARLLKLTTELEEVIKKDGFPDAWNKAESAKEIKAAVISAR
jgi:basic amino acid/polyamine antiporter, APA family